MHIREGIRLAFLQIRQEKLKSSFSVLGVAIGVMFLIVVVSVVEGMDRYITEDFSSQVYGVNTIQVRRFPQVQINPQGAQRRAELRRPHPTVAEATELRDRLTVPVRVGVESNVTGEIRTSQGRRVEQAQIQAVSRDILEIRDLRLAAGRPFSEQEETRGIPVAILGTTVTEALFPDEVPLGHQIRIQGFPYRVVGVLAEQGSLLGISLDNRVMIPVTSRIGRIHPERGAVGQIVIQTVDPTDLRQARAETEAILRIARRLRPDQASDFHLDTAEDSLAFWDRISTILFLALPGLVGISLVVGSIVIMNIMLVSVMARTREVGVRKALGARPRDIVGQFLLEAATLSGAGAVVGVGIGLGLTVLVRTFTPLPASVAPHWVALGVALGIFVGVVAGVYPAVRASRLDPVEALGYE